MEFKYYTFNAEVIVMTQQFLLFQKLEKRLYYLNRGTPEAGIITGLILHTCWGCVSAPLFWGCRRCRYKSNVGTTQFGTARKELLFMCGSLIWLMWFYLEALLTDRQRTTCMVRSDNNVFYIMSWMTFYPVIMMLTAPPQPHKTNIPYDCELIICSWSWWVWYD